MTINFKETEIHFEDYGSGQTVVLLHGFLENSTMWDEFIPLFSVENRIITVDLLGHGQTGCIGYVHSMELMAESVNRVLEHLDIDEALLIGHSMGGYVALAFAELYPKKINGLCLMNSTAAADSEERKLNRDRAIKAVKQNHTAFIGMSVANLFAENNRIRFSKEIDEVKKEALKMPVQGVVAALEGMKDRKERSEVLSAGTFKKMVVLGKKDPVLDFDMLINQMKPINIKIVEFPDGHMSHIENKKELSYNLIQFIEK